MKEYHMYDSQGFYSLAVVEDDECTLFVTDQYEDGLQSLVQIKKDLESGECDVQDVYGTGVADDPQACYDQYVEKLDAYYTEGKWTELRELDDDDIQDRLNDMSD